MTTENTEKEIETTTPLEEAAAPVEEVVVSAPEAPKERERDARFAPRGRGGEGRGRRPARAHSRVKPEFDQKIVSLRRVTRVMGGGRRFSFSVALVAGNRKGSVGVGQGKATDTPLAIEKAFRDAKKNMILVNTTNVMSIPHEVEAKYAASWVKIRPARGKGILAGSSVRTVLELAGLKEVGAKLYSRSKNNANNAYAAIKALRQLEGTKLQDRHK